MKVLILGGSGYVGSEFRRVMDQWHWPYIAPSHRDVDFGNIITLYRLVQNYNPTFLINCAGYTGKPNVDACEKDKVNCISLNVSLPSSINIVCKDLGIKWGHVSSGCIFQGDNNGKGFSEDDTPNFMFDEGQLSGNCSFYSGTKALGEQMLGYEKVGNSWLTKAPPSCYIWRLRIPFNEKNSSRNYLTKLQNYERLLDAENSLSHLREFVESCLYSYQKDLPLGIYNVTNPGFIRTSEVTDMMTKYMKDKPFFKYFEDEDEFNKVVATPRSNCVLNSSKIVNSGIKMRSVHDAVEHAIKGYVYD